MKKYKWLNRELLELIAIAIVLGLLYIGTLFLGVADSLFIFLGLMITFGYMGYSFCLRRKWKQPKNL